jgi:hypothetical protein
MKHTKKKVGTVQALMLLAISGTAAFGLGIRSAEDGKSVIDPIMASDSVQGDLNRDGELNNDDLTIAIEIATGIRSAEPEELKNDPNKDGAITNADALWIVDHMRNAEGKRINR